MSKSTINTAGVVALMLLTVALIAPGLFMAYGVLFGHHYTSDQGWAAVGLATLGFFTGMFAGIAWSEM